MLTGQGFLPGHPVRLYIDIRKIVTLHADGQAWLAGKRPQMPAAAGRGVGSQAGASSNTRHSGWVHVMLYGRM